MKKKVIIRFKIAIFLAVAAGFCGCNPSQNHTELEAPPSERAMLVYMAADNDLSPDAARNLKLIEQGLPAGGRMAVYVDRRGGEPPQLLSLYRSRTGAEVEKAVLKSYPEHNSATVEVMSEVLTDMQHLMPAQSYGLVLWSHGTGWLPGNRAGGSRAFGQDGTTWMEIEQLAEMLPDNGFDFILFDACFMASVEVMYALRHKAPWIIASSAEVIADGFPYDQITLLFYGDTPHSLQGICDRFYNYYNHQSGAWRTATVSLVRTAALEPLALSLQRRLPTTKGVQYFDRNRPHLIFDLGDAFGMQQSTLSGCVDYVAATEYVMQGQNGFRVNKHSGLTTYVMGQNSQLDEAYIKTAWYKTLYK